PTAAGNGSQRPRGATKDRRTCASSGRAPGELSLPSAALPRSTRPERAKRASHLRGEPAAGADGDRVWGHRKRAARAEHARALDGPPGSLEEEAETGAAAPPP